jgi:hypothetical protein
MVNMFEPKVFELVHGYFSRTLLDCERKNKRGQGSEALVRKDDIMMVRTSMKVVSVDNGERDRGDGHGGMIKMVMVTFVMNDNGLRTY